MLNRGLIQSLTALLPDLKNQKRLTNLIHVLKKNPLDENDYAKFFFVIFAILNEMPDILRNSDNKLLLQLVINCINNTKIVTTLEENRDSAPKKHHPPFRG